MRLITKWSTKNFFSIALLTYLIIPLQEPKNFDNLFKLTFILLARLGRFLENWYEPSVIFYLFSLQLRTEIFYKFGWLDKTHLLRVTLLHSSKSFQESRQIVCQKRCLPAFCCCLSLLLSWPFSLISLERSESALELHGFKKLTLHFFFKAKPFSLMRTQSAVLEIDFMA